MQVNYTPGNTLATIGGIVWEEITGLLTSDDTVCALVETSALIEVAEEYAADAIDADRKAAAEKVIAALRSEATCAYVNVDGTWSEESDSPSLECDSVKVIDATDIVQSAALWAALADRSDLTWGANSYSLVTAAKLAQVIEEIADDEEDTGKAAYARSIVAGLQALPTDVFINLEQ